MDWKTWLKSLAAAAIGGAATGAANSLAGGQTNGKVAITAGVGALATVLAYLMRSPLGPASPADALPAGSPANLAGTGGAITAMPASKQ